MTSVGVSGNHLMVVAITIWAFVSKLFSRKFEYDKIDALRGLNITITTTAKTDEEAKALLSLFKFPFKG